MTNASSETEVHVERAVYGASRKGHGLLSASGERNVADIISARLDLPDTAPPGATWSPYYSGFPFREHYILAVTTSDEKAARAGMVASHALIVKLKDFVAVDNLEPFFDVLRTRQTHDFQSSCTVRVASKVAVQSPAAQAAVRTLSVPSADPAVCVGNEGFDAIVAEIWQFLTPGIRENFSFRLSFRPADLIESPKPALVFTPTSLVSKWPHDRIVIVGAVKQPKSLVESLLAGEKGGQELLNFSVEIGAGVKSFAELGLIEQAYRMKANASSTFQSAVAFARLVARLSPERSKGKTFKSSLLQTLHSGVRSAEPGDVSRIRNLSLSFLAGEQIFWDALAERAQDYVSRPSQDLAILHLINEAFLSDEPVPQWRKAISSAALNALESGRAGATKAFWKWIEAGEALGETILSQLSLSADLDYSLACAAPLAINVAATDKMLSACEKGQWLCLHAALLSRKYDLLDALKRQLTIDSNPSNLRPLEIIASNAESSEIIACSLMLEDARVGLLAAARLAKAPSLLGTLDIGEPYVQSIWSIALDCQPHAWDGSAEGRRTVVTLLDVLLSGSYVDNSLLQRLASTPLANLTEYQFRSSIWGIIDSPAREGFLNQTAGGWLANASELQAIEGLEPLLKEAVSRHPDFDKTLECLSRKRIDVAFRLREVAVGCDEASFMKMLDRGLSGRIISTHEAEGIGALIQKKHWANAAARLARQAGERSDLTPAVEVCFSLLPILTRFFGGFGWSTPVDKWDVFEEIANELYPQGPSAEDVWHRAGGSYADLTLDGSGRTRWHRAIQLIQSGGPMTATALLDAMSESYPNNEALRRLRRSFH